MRLPGDRGAFVSYGNVSFIIIIGNGLWVTHSYAIFMIITRSFFISPTLRGRVWVIKTFNWLLPYASRRRIVDYKAPESEMEIKSIFSRCVAIVFQELTVISPITRYGNRSTDRFVSSQKGADEC